MQHAPNHAVAASGPAGPGLRWSWLALLPLVAGLLWIGGAPSHAAGENWSVIGVNTVGCTDFAWSVDTRRAGLDGGYYTWHAQVSSGGKVSMNEGFVEASLNGDVDWTLYSTYSYGAVDNPGTYPLTPGTPMKLVLTVERPIGTVVSSWTMVARSCDSTDLLYNGPTSADLDEDYLATPTDRCPTLRSVRDNGCPLHDRALSLKARYGPKRVVGRLSASHRSLYAGRTVTVWKARPGPDRKVALRTTDSNGRFKARVGKGRHYATSPGLIVPTVGQSVADRSVVVRIR